MSTPITLAFRFLVTIDGVKREVSNRPGDVVRVRQHYASGELDEMLGSAGTGAIEAMQAFAWRAISHDTDWESITFDEFLDRCEDIEILNGEQVRPTNAVPLSGS